MASKGPKLQKSTIRMAERLMKSAGLAAVVTRENKELGCERVIPARRTLLDPGSSEKTLSQDRAYFGIIANEYTLQGQRVDPEKFDRIRVEDCVARKIYEYEVVESDGGRFYQKVDQYGIMIRVATKFVSESDA